MPILLPTRDITLPPVLAEPVPDGRRTRTASTVLRAVLDHGPIARSGIAQRTGLSPAAVSRQGGDLIALGLLRELRVPLARGRQPAGRPHVPVDLATGPVACGVHLAVRHSTLALADLRGRVLVRTELPHASDDPLTVLDGAADATAAFLDRHAAGRPVLGVGLATGGWVDPARGLIVSHPSLGWADVPATDAFERRLGLPARVESHSRSLARAEQLVGDHGRRARSGLVHLFVGNVVDAAFALDGTVHHGPRSAAGDVSHLPIGGGEGPTGPAGLTGSRCSCGRRGCLSSSVSSRSVALHAVATGVLDRPHYPDLLHRAAEGHPGAVALLRERARLVGRAAALLLDLLDPEVLVITESSLAADPTLLDHVHAEVAERARPGTDARRAVVASSFGIDAPGVAAASVVLHEVYERPLGLVARESDYFPDSEN